MRFTIKLLVTSSVMCFFSLMAMANEASVFSIKNAGSNSISLQVKNVIQAQIQMTLKDMSGVVLHDETISKNRINNRKYDLRNLPTGRYSVIVSYDNVIKVQKIKKEFDRIDIDTDNVQTMFRPAFIENADYLDLNVLSLSKQWISLMIKDDDGHVIYNKRNQIDGSFQKRFNLSELKEGSYTFMVEFVDANINKAFKKTLYWSPSITAL